MYRRLIPALMHTRPHLGRRLAFTHARLNARLLSHLNRLAGRETQVTPVEVMGLPFPNPLGIAAGFDKQGRLGREAGALGFGHIEIGTLTPRDIVLHLSQSRRQYDNASILGINIGKNPETPLRSAWDDYRYCLRSAWPHADYIAINLCSRHIAELLHPAYEKELDRLLTALKQEQRTLTALTGRYVPLAVKIKLSLAVAELPKVIPRLAELRYDALIAAIDAGPPATPQQYARWQAPEQQQQACRQIKRLASKLSGHLPIITVGGISSARHVRERLRAGAALVQMHNALVYEGPGIGVAIQHATHAIE